MRKRNFTLFVFLFCLGLFQLFAQKDILMYSSDFTDWPAKDYSTALSTDVNFLHAINSTTFSAINRPIVHPAEAIGGKTGYISFGGSSGATLSVSNLPFISGGCVVVEVCHSTTSSGRTLTLTANGSSAGIFSEFTVTPTMGSIPTSVSGNVANFGRPAAAYGIYEVTYYLPPSINGDRVKLDFTESSNNLNICSIKIYSGVGPVPYIVNTSSQTLLQKPMYFKGILGGPKVTNSIKIKSYNFTSDVSLSIVGQDSLRFRLPVNSLNFAQTSIGCNVNVEYIPSNSLGNHKAKLRLSAPGVEDRYVDLVGVTSTNTSPELIVSSDTIPFWTSLIKPVSYSINILGANLTDNVHCSITGVNSSSFTINVKDVSAEEAFNNKEIAITYLGRIAEGIDNANLLITSVGADTVLVPLKGITTLLLPKLYPLSFEANPKGSAVIETSPRGNRFPEGTKVSVKVTPEAGCKMYYWSDGKSGALTSRTVPVSNIKNGLITVNLKPTESATVIEPILLLAYQPTNITTNSFTASWSAIAGASNYTVTVYEGSNVHGTPIMVNTNTAIITGLNPGISYSYKVKANTGEESALVGPFSTTAIITSTCTK